MSEDRKIFAVLYLMAKSVFLTREARGTPPSPLYFV
jgi:hypothetical protein